MPPRVSTPPPVTARASKSLLAMSLITTPRPFLEPNLLRSPESYISGAGRQSDLPQEDFNFSDLVLPPLQARPQLDQIRNYHHHESNPRSYTNVQDQQWPNQSISRQVNQSYQSSSFSPINSATGNPNDAPVQRRQSRGDSPPRQNVDPGKKEWRPDILKVPSPVNMPLRSYVEDVPRSTLEQYRAENQEIESDMAFGLATSRSSEGRKFSSTFQYELLIRQQPIAARACGFGERDRRTIDPPPILQMIVHDLDATKTKPSSKVNYPPESVVHCELWNANADAAVAHMPEIVERRQQRRLMGTLVASPFFGGDEFDIDGCFFPFPDLSCRTTGKYRLKFTLVIIDPFNIKPGDKLPVKATVISNVFEVYTAKTFPGMIESTELTKRLKAQGCLITVKRGHQRPDRKRATRSSQENDQAISDDGEGDYNDFEQGHDKRQKT